MIRTARILLLLALLPAAATAGLELGPGIPPMALLPDAVFDPAVPSPAEVLGTDIAQRPYRPDEVLRYFELLARTSPRAELREYARSHEGRPLVLLAISDEEAVADLDGFRERHAALLDPRNGLDPAGAKAVAWMAYGIHGDELSSTDAAVFMAYWLVAGEDDHARQLRRELLILIDPCENPDGRARYLAQILSFAHRRANPDQADLSHRSVWPWGRGNHYLFDMNRDWFSQVHPESERSTQISRWLPQLLVDSHEMGANSTYLFPPPRHPYNPHLPDNTRHWEHTFSADQASALDDCGYPYFNGEWNEEFFPGYGSSWCAYHGTVGVLYEMSRTTGQVVRKRDGTMRTFAQAVEHQVVSSVANLGTLADNRAAVLADMIDARAAAVDAGRKGDLRAWIIPPDPRRPARVPAFAEHLEGQGLEVHVLQAPVRAKGLRSARSGAATDHDLPAGTLMVRLDQPSGSMVHALLDPHVPMDAGFLRDEREYLEKGKGTRLYEVTAWSMLLGRGLPAYWTGRLPGGDWSRWEPADSAPTVAPVPDLSGPWNSVVFAYGPDHGPCLLADLLQAGLTVRIAEKDFAAAGRSFRRGAIVVRREGNPRKTPSVLSAAVRRHGAEAVPVLSFNAESGPDLGGSHVPVLVEPRVAVLTGMPVSPTAYGAVWHLLDQELDLRFTALDVGRFRDADLTRYNVIVMPSIMGGDAAYRRLLGGSGMARLKSWIEAGGTAIGFRGGARLLADPRSGICSTRFRYDALASHPSPVWSLGAAEVEAAGNPSALGLRTSAVASSVRTDPYDVAPILGPGARPFADGVPQGTPLGGTPVAMDAWLRDVLPDGQAAPDTLDLARADGRLRRFLPRGAMLQAELHDESWLTHGLDADATVLFRGEDAMIAAPPAVVAARFSGLDDLHRGGLLWPEAAARIAGTAYAVRESVGRGQVVLFASEPAFRRWMAESERLFVNAILMGPGLGTRWASPW